MGVAAAGRLPLAAQPVAPGSRGVRRMNAWLTPDWPPARAGLRDHAQWRGQPGTLDSLEPWRPRRRRSARAVEENRRRLTERLECRPSWLDQVHGVTVVEADPSRVLRADASWSAMPGVACTIMTADCLPALFCDRSGTRWPRPMPAGAGWRRACWRRRWTARACPATNCWSGWAGDRPAGLRGRRRGPRCIRRCARRGALGFRT